MNKFRKNLLGVIAVALFLWSPVIADPGGGGGGHGSGHGGGGGGYGGGGRSNFERSTPSGSPRPHAEMPRGNSYHQSPTTLSGHPFSGGPGHSGRPIGPHHPYYGNWYHGDWHDHWARPWYGGPVGWFSVGFVTGAVVWDAPWHWGYWPYYNPYCTEVIVVDNTAIDYSRPIVLAAPPAAIDPSQAENQAMQLLDASRAAFAKADYPTAMALINQAISRRPNDSVLHEFRALILFATQQYQPAAAAVYAVLSVGPGWDWATLGSFYPNPEVYTRQLRALEQRRNENPSVAELRFLLAYHYMSCGHTEVAARELKEVVRLNPKDQLSVQLLAGLSGAKPEAIPAPSQPPAPARPVGAANLVGVWEAARTDGASFAFTLTNEATYSWQYTQAGKTQQYSGVYTVADNLLILKKDGSPVMIGQVTLLEGQRFNFKLVGGNPSDPGLTFSKKFKK